MAEVRECKMEDCSLWGFRMGKNPNRTGKGGRKDWNCEKVNVLKYRTVAFSFHRGRDYLNDER